MLDMKTLLQVVVISVVLGILFGTLMGFLFPGWYQENPMLASMILGGFCGPIIAIFMKTRNN